MIYEIQIYQYEKNQNINSEVCSGTLQYWHEKWKTSECESKVKYQEKSNMNEHNQVKVFKNGSSQNCGRQSLKNLKRYGLLGQTISLQFF